MGDAERVVMVSINKGKEAKKEGGGTGGGGGEGGTGGGGKSRGDPRRWRGLHCCIRSGVLNDDRQTVPLSYRSKVLSASCSAVSTFTSTSSFSVCMPTT